MSADNVTPIRPPGGSTEPPAKNRTRRAPRKRRVLYLDDGGPHGFDNQDVFRGLYGVCLALDQNVSKEAQPWLASAARVLAAILHHRAEEA